MKDKFASDIQALGDNDEIRAILKDVCRVTGMGFAAVACVTGDRFIACQVHDTIAFGLRPGDELDISTTICQEVRGHGQRVFIDNVAGDPEWQHHPVPALYGFQSYVSIPLILENGSFFGTLCAIDPEPRDVTAPETVAALSAFAIRVALLLASAPVGRLN